MRPATVLVGEDHDGSDVVLAVGGTLEIRLPELKKSYRWQLSETEEELPLRSAQALPSEATTPRERVFRLNATSPGQYDVGLRLVQPWKAEADPVERFTVTVHVR